ncbi:M13-type metalloendopeptidase [Actinomycetota bacterium]
MSTQAAEPAVSPGTLGGTGPTQSLYHHANGDWLSNTSIPDDETEVRMVDEVTRRLRQDLVAIVCADRSDASARLVSGLFNSFMNTDAIDELSLAALEPDLTVIRNVVDIPSLCHAFGALARRGVTGPFEVWVGPDGSTPQFNAAHLEPAGLTLPDPSLYVATGFEHVVGGYRDYLAGTMALADVPDPAGTSARAVALETELAHAIPAASRGATTTRRLSSVEDLRVAAPRFDWTRWAEGLSGGAWPMTAMVVTDPAYLTAVDGLLLESHLERWKSWLLARTLYRRAPFLPQEFVDGYFHFFGEMLMGLSAQSPRTKRGVDLTLALAAPEVTELYIAQVPNAQLRKEAAEALADRLRDALVRRVQRASHLSSATRTRAVRKLHGVTLKVAFPDQLEVCAIVELDDRTLIENIARLTARLIDHEADRIGTPFEVDRWFYHHPHTPNLGYDATSNEVVIPLAMLAAPYFDPDWPPARNHGRLGALIAHELAHALDDIGMQFDEDGRLESWVEDVDRAYVLAQHELLTSHFQGLRPEDTPDGEVDGKRTLGENLADIVGLATAHDALSGADLAARRDLFLEWARLWRAKRRPEKAVERLMSDPHCPPEIRSDQVVRHLDAFHAAFDTRPEDPMWLEPRARLSLWAPPVATVEKRLP